MIVFLVLFVLGFVNTERPLHGHNLRVALWEVGSSVERNINGHIERTSLHFEVLKWLSAKLGFKFTVLPYMSANFANATNTTGLSTFLLNGQADIFAGAVTMTDSVQAKFDLPFPWIWSNYKFMIPVPKPNANFGAPWQTFSPVVWICIFVAVLAIISSLYFVNFFEIFRGQNFFNLNRSIDYTTSVFFAQGGYCHPRNHSIRLVAGVWCIGTFFLVNSYTSTLVSLITKPVQVPVINSIYDLPNKPNVYVAIEAGMGLNRIISNSQSGILKYLDDTLKNEPNIRCSTLTQCLEKVVDGTHVFAEVRDLLTVYINRIINPRFGNCRVMIANEGFMTAIGSFALPKNSPYTEHINRETIALIETGFLTKWANDFYPYNERCLEKPKQVRISLQNLSSCFVFLVVGVLISLISFIAEVIFKKYKKN